MLHSDSSDRLSLSEAAKLVGKSTSTVRRLVDLGSLKTTRDETGKHYVARSDVLTHYSAQAHAVTNRPSKPERSGAQASHADPRLTLYSDAQMDVVKLKAENDGLRSQLQFVQDTLRREQAKSDKLESDLVSLMHEMKALLGKETGLSRWFRK